MILFKIFMNQGLNNGQSRCSVKYFVISAVKDAALHIAVVVV